MSDVSAPISGRSPYRCTAGSGLPGSDAVYDVTHERSEIGVTCHVWAKTELESYVLVPSVIARLNRDRIGQVLAVLDELAEDLWVTVESNYLAERRRELSGSKLSDVSINTMVIPEFEKAWEHTQSKAEAGTAERAAEPAQ